MAYQGTFAIITAALISGAVVERMRFGPYLAFIVLWTLLVYAPMAHWVWGGGWLMTRGVLDFAGGTVVHINAGVSAAGGGARCSASGRTTAARPSCPTTCRSCCSAPGLLWFGWFGFNGGSALAANELAALAFTNTFLAPMATLVVWVLLDYFRTGRATAVGGATGDRGRPRRHHARGRLREPERRARSSAPSPRSPATSSSWSRSRTRLDDSLDVFAGHGVGGITGALLTGVFASEGVEPGRQRRPAGRQPGPARRPRRSASAAAIVYSAVATFVLLKVLGFVTALRAAPEDRRHGHGRDPARRGGLHQRRRLDPGHLRSRRPAMAPAPVLNPQTAAR